MGKYVLRNGFEFDSIFVNEHTQFKEICDFFGDNLIDARVVGIPGSSMGQSLYTGVCVTYRYLDPAVNCCKDLKVDIPFGSFVYTDVSGRYATCDPTLFEFMFEPAFMFENTDKEEE